MVDVRTGPVEVVEEVIHDPGLLPPLDAVRYGKVAVGRQAHVREHPPVVLHKVDHDIQLGPETLDPLGQGGTMSYRVPEGAERLVFDQLRMCVCICNGVSLKGRGRHELLENGDDVDPLASRMVDPHAATPEDKFPGRVVQDRGQVHVCAVQDRPVMEVLNALQVVRRLDEDVGLLGKQDRPEPGEDPTLPPEPEFGRCGQWILVAVVSFFSVFGVWKTETADGLRPQTTDEDLQVFDMIEVDAGIRSKRVVPGRR